MVVLISLEAEQIGEWIYGIGDCRDTWLIVITLIRPLY